MPTSDARAGPVMKARKNKVPKINLLEVLFDSSFSSNAIAHGKCNIPYISE